MYAIAWTPKHESLLRFEANEQGELLGNEELVLEQDAILGWDASASAIKIAQSPLEERLARHKNWSVHTEHRDGISTVWAQYGGEGKAVLWSKPAIALAPAVYAVEDGAWIAFHHNWRSDRQCVDVSKWIELRFVNLQGQVFEPKAPMPDLNRDAEGEEQGFEFPSLVLGEQGSLALFGRGSHCFWWQSLGEQGWTRRVPMGAESTWGCRGRRVAAVASGTHILSARRERAGIEIAKHDFPVLGNAQKFLMPCVAEKELTAPSPIHRHAKSISERLSKEKRMTLFGDIHQHSAHSDGVGGADEPYLRARYQYGDDFCALTDHESFLGKRIGPGEWRYLCKTTESHHQDGEFVTLYAYEWTAKAYPGPGHKVVYLSSEGGEIVSRDVISTGKELLDAVYSAGGFAVPHHVGWTGADLEAHDERKQPVWEICSCHGCYEYADHPLGQRGEHKEQMVLNALQQGLRFGFIACSDSHGLLWHHGMARKRDPFRTGLTVVQAREKSREAILSAIKERRCYATSGDKIIVDFRVDGAPMGSVIKHNKAMMVTLDIRATAPVQNIVFMADQGEIHRIPYEEPAESELHVEWEFNDQHSRFLYARIEQNDGEMAWLSPVFFER
ncbi:MAG: CehA/McbA family metallohydrolase [Myxococcales bacterium]|nr:MAG: CehA/McbA family metallohydrolase [Myxococcales bacterium]